MSWSTNPVKVRETLRLRSLGLNNTQIAESGTIGLVRSTIIELLNYYCHYIHP